MKLVKLSHALTLAGVLSLGAAFSLDVQSAEYKPKAKVVSLLQGPLAGVEGKDVIVKHFTLPAGFVGGKHFHPGPVFVYIIEGTLTVETAEQGVQSFSAGELYVEPVGRTMQGKNLNADTPLKLVVFQVGEAGKPMMIKAK